MTNHVVLVATAMALTEPATSALAGPRASPGPEVQRPLLSQEFERYDTSGGMVVLQRGRLDRLVVVGDNRSRFRDLPSSTFKIPIALDRRLVFQQSCIPIFQALARRVRRPAYERTLRAMDYGNGRLDGTSVDDFWLHGPFGISPRQQVTFLERLRTGRLPVRRQAVKAAQDMLVPEREDGVTFRGKTGFVHIDMTRSELIPRRVTNGRAILRKLHASGRR